MKKKTQWDSHLVQIPTKGLGKEKDSSLLISFKTQNQSINFREENTQQYLSVAVIITNKSTGGEGAQDSI